MRVQQRISIGTLRINSMSNSSIIQIGASGSMKARAKEINEYVPASEANQKIEGQIQQAVQPLMQEQGLLTEDQTNVTVGESANGTPREKCKKRT